MRSLFGGSQKPTPQTVLKALLQQVSASQSPIITAAMVPHFMKFTKNLDMAGELVLAITDYIDEVADNPTSVYKCMQLLLYCLSKAPNTVFKAAQAFAPEILTVNLLTFERPSSTIRDAIQILTHQIYNHIMRNKPLPSLDKYKLDFKVAAHQQNAQHQHQQQHTQQQNQHQQQPQQPQQPQFAHRPPTLGRKPQTNYDDMFSFDRPKEKVQQGVQSRENMLPENERPRAPAAFAAFASGKVEAVHQLPRGEDSLLSFDDDDNGNESHETDLFHEFGDFSNEGNEASQQSNENDFFFTSFDDKTQNELDGTEFNPFADIEEPKQTPKKEEVDDLFAVKPITAPKSTPKKDLFDPFSGLDIKTQKTEKKQDNDEFDPFADFTAKQETKSQKTNENDSFDPFADFSANSKSETSTTEKQDNNGFDLFTNSSLEQKQNDDNSFDPFGDLTTQKQTNETIPKTTNSNDNTFDPFGDITTQKQTNDTFDPFGNSSSIEKLSPKPKQKSLREVFSEKESNQSNKPQNKTLGSAPKKQSVNVFDLITPVD